MDRLTNVANQLSSNPAIQRLRDNLQELPGRLLQGVASRGAKDSFLGTVSGECNYHFTFRLQGTGFFQTGVLVASAESSPPGTGGLPVPLRCRWRRRIGQEFVEIQGVTSNMYQISADDIGTQISVEAQPADAEDGFSGVMTGVHGPFELDLATRRLLDNALGQGGCRFVVAKADTLEDMPAAGERREKSEVAVVVTADEVRIASASASGRDLAVEYRAEYPKVIIHPLDVSKFEIRTSETRAFQFAAASRTARDLIVLTIRCFHARKHVPSLELVNRLLPVQMSQGAGGANGYNPRSPIEPEFQDGKLDTCIILERLAREQNRAVLQKDVLEKTLRNTSMEKQELQEQLMETISGFTEVIEGVNEQFVDAGPVPTMSGSHQSAEKSQEQLREATAVNQALKSDIQRWREEADALATQRKAVEQEHLAKDAAGEAQRLREEKTLLQAKLKELRCGDDLRDRKDMVHTQELRRLRHDVEELHDQKELLRRQLHDAEKERNELQENFLYVKTQLDKVQLRQAAEEAGVLNEVDKQRNTLQNATDERSRLSSRLEIVLREAEKEKAYHEQSLERVMSANARLLEERDRAAKEVQRISELYAESVRQVGIGGYNRNVDDTSPSLLTTAGSGAFADAEELVRLRAQLAESDELLLKKDQENEALKMRIRKLAVSG
eukprot:TRINITY_DN1613_c0_g2_i1.p1 TRINITY_DN1613_c0_g2~~TRINITY_DN1613_c0_g2_i1.p1  ORF type:complete len:670 (-),score=214.25 TRINITY_DN1613_c0_g2_i1:83-2092(-)